MTENFKNIWLDTGENAFANKDCDECNVHQELTIFFGSPDDHSGLNLCFFCLERVYKHALVAAALKGLSYEHVSPKT